MNEIWMQSEYSNYVISNTGKVYSYYSNRLLKPRKNRNGYPCILVYEKGKKKKLIAVHKLTYETFRGKVPSDMQINHKDEDKTNNAIWNLNLCTAKENSNWGTRNNRISSSIKGKNNVEILQYTKDGDLIREWHSLTDASDFYGVKKCTLWGAINCHKGAKTCKGYIWKYKERETD